jgi:hypothetical protein
MRWLNLWTTDTKMTEYLASDAEILESTDRRCFGRSEDTSDTVPTFTSPEVKTVPERSFDVTIWASVSISKPNWSLHTKISLVAEFSSVTECNWQDSYLHAWFTKKCKAEKKNAAQNWHKLKNVKSTIFGTIVNGI